MSIGDETHRSEELKTLVLEAQLLRDYLLRANAIGPQDLVELIDALMPFENSSKSPSLDQQKALYLAFEKVKRHSAEKVDNYTMNEVLAGRSPFLRRAPLVASIAVTLIGVILVYLAVHFTFWSNRSTQLLLDAERFGTFDHFGQMTRLVEQALNYGPSAAELAEAAELGEGAERKPPDPEMVVFFERLALLNQHYVREQKVFHEMAAHFPKVVPFEEQGSLLFREVCPEPFFRGEGDPPPLSFFQIAFACTPPLVVAGQPIAPEPEDTGQKSKKLVAFDEVAEFQAAEQAAMLAAGRSGRPPYLEAVQTIRQWSELYKSRISMVTSIFLPIVYGMLGSIIYCMWRILNRSVSPLGFWYTLLRISFAGLAALTLSTLIVPSNILTFGFEATRPFIYLLSFIFGYSIESAVDALNLLNRTLRPKAERSGQTEKGGRSQA